MQSPKHRLAFYELAVLFFMQWMALAAWTVPLTLVLKSHGLAKIQPFAFATAALGAVITPLFFGAVADRHVAPARVLRWLTLASAASMSLCCWAIQSGWNAWLVLGLIQLYSFCSAPASSISSALALSAVDNPRRDFGRIRGMGTLGWMAGCLVVSMLNADASTHAGFAAALIWLGLSGYTFFLPHVPPPASATNLTWHERMGLDALALLKESDHRVVFLTALLWSIPLTAFYPHTPAHLADLGFKHPAAWMSLGQTTELIAMFTLGALLLRVRLKWILTAGLVFSVVRFIFCALDSSTWLLAGVVLHGASYAYVFATTQIYINERVAPNWRTRAQALLSLLNSGVGNFVGYLATGWWYTACTSNGLTRWPLFWGGMATTAGAVLIYFLVAYHGRGVSPKKTGNNAGTPLTSG